MLVTTVISGMPVLTSWGHMTLLSLFIMVLASDTENVSFFSQYIHLKKTKIAVYKQILKIYHKSNTLMPNNDS